MIYILNGRLQYAILSLISLQSTYLSAQIDCSTLESSRDQEVCRNVLADTYTPYSEDSVSGWLNSVQKITAGTAITQELLANTNRLYIFDHETADGERAVYDFPAATNLPANSVIISNGTANSKPKFLMGESDDGSQFAAIHSGYNAVVNVEITSRTNESVHELFLAAGSTGVTLSGVTLSADYTPPETDSITVFNLLTLGYKSGVPTDFRIENCDFLLPDIEPTGHRVAMSAINIQGAQPGSSSYSTMIVTFRGNRVVSKDYNQTPADKITVAGFGVSGLVRLTGSYCNSIVDWQNNSLLSDSSYQHWLGGFNNVDNQALGFRNGKGWGWRQTNGQTNYIYTTWDDWSQHGVNISCNEPTRPPLVPATTPGTPPDDNSGGSGLAVKIAVPIAVVVVMIVVTAAGILGGRQVWKSWNSKRIRRAATAPLLTND